MIQRLLQLHKNKKKLQTQPNPCSFHMDLYIGEAKPIFQSRLHGQLNFQHADGNDLKNKKTGYQPKSDRAAFNRKFISIKMRKKNMHTPPNNIHKPHIEDKIKDKTTYQNKKASIKLDLNMTHLQVGYLSKNYFCVSSSGPNHHNNQSSVFHNRKRSWDSKFITSAIWPTCSKVHQLGQQNEEHFEKYKKEEQPQTKMLLKTRYLTTRSLSNRKSSYTHQSNYENKPHRGLRLSTQTDTDSHNNQYMKTDSNSNLQLKLKMSIQQRNSMLSNSIDISPWKYGHSKNNIDSF